MSIDDWIKRIHAYLADNQTQAFMPGDLASRIRSRLAMDSPKSDDADFKAALEKLCEMGSVKIRIVKSVPFYSYGSYLKS